MLNTAQKYQKAFERYSDEDPYYRLDLEAQDGPGVPNKADWDRARKMAEFLEHFYDLTLHVSVTSRPTSHTYFHEIADVLLLLREWCHSEDNLSKEMGKRMLVKYYKYWGNKYGERQGDIDKRGEKDKGDQLLNFVVFYCVAIDPRYKLSNCIRMGIKVMFGDTVGEKVWETVNTYFHALFDEYKEMYGPNDKAPQPAESESTTSNSKRVSRWMTVITQQINNEGGSVKSELDKYLSEDNEVDTAGFDIRSGGRPIQQDSQYSLVWPVICWQFLSPQLPLNQPLVLVAKLLMTLGPHSPQQCLSASFVQMIGFVEETMLVLKRTPSKWLSLRKVT
jgi:hypothetical protein